MYRQLLNCKNYSILQFVFIFFTLIIYPSILFGASEATGSITYKFTSNISQSDINYQRITAAMDSAIYFYNTYTTLSKKITVEYNSLVQTADGNINGNIRFGPKKQYQVTLSAMHEIAHTLGVGTTQNWCSLINGSKVYTGTYGAKKLKEIDGNNAVLKGDSHHFWPYGLNYAREVKSNQDLINHCLIVNEMYKDLFPGSIPTGVASVEATSYNLQIKQGNALQFLVTLPEASRIDAAVFSTNGTMIVSQINKRSEAGHYSIQFDKIKRAQGRYIYRIVTNTVVQKGIISIIRK